MKSAAEVLDSLQLLLLFDSDLQAVFESPILLQNTKAFFLSY